MSNERARSDLHHFRLHRGRVFGGLRHLRSVEESMMPEPEEREKLDPRSVVFGFLLGMFMWTVFAGGLVCIAMGGVK
jgi:hypothetical protein